MISLDCSFFCDQKNEPKKVFAKKNVAPVRRFFAARYSSHRIAPHTKIGVLQATPLRLFCHIIPIQHL